MEKENLVCFRKYTNLRVNICRDVNGYYVCVFDSKGRYLFQSSNRFESISFGSPCFIIETGLHDLYLCLNNPREMAIDLNAPRIMGCHVLAHCVCNGWLGE